MPMGKFRGIALVWILLVSLLLSLLPVLMLGPVPVQAQAPCSVAGTIELAYDDGIPMDRALPAGVGNCPPCTNFQGVRFELPEGIPTATLTMTRIYAGASSARLTVHVTDDQMENLMEPVVFSVKGSKWYEVPLPNVVVPHHFYIWVDRGGSSYFNIGQYVEPFFDGRRTGPSWYGETPTYPILQQPPGDFMIRAEVNPIVDVGKGANYEYHDIQAAVDNVSIEGMNIKVHEGVYNENVTVDKSFNITAVDGPAKTIVQTPYTDKDVFKVTANCVGLSGFTIRGATDTGAAGVRVEGASNCVVSGNVILDNSYGIYVSENSTRNIFLENECKFNTNGIYVDGSGNYISGNKLHGNTAPAGSAVLLSASASGNDLRFNSIWVDPGTDPAVAAGAQVSNQNSNQEVSAVENWWGTDSGPSNAGGQGPVVGEMVVFDPWLTKQPLRVKTVAASDGDFTMDARAETSTIVLKQGTGTPFVSTASFGENPFGTFPGKPMGKWIDVLFSSTDGIDQVEIRQYYTTDDLAGLKEGSLRLFWWNGKTWKVCSKSSVDKKNDFVWARLNAKSKPNLDNLNGTMFAVGVPKAGFAWWLIPLVIVIVIIALIAFRLFWVLVVKRESYPLD